ncbi:hypothetical protein GQ55_2G036000 [Panicum hallii var. hallii]|uniref:Uncharacterized protein n=1 Tax=Panicum hallii var. hallii TaxID=1504633 RepID=A0A2T7EL32_9POAL|nr:hypothetical protein GQ55_2G036000 [Panicum hallii var. hallii]
MKGDAGGGGRVRLQAPAAGAPSPLADTIFHLCMKTAIVLGSCHVVFVVYIAMTYTQSWLEKLRVLPLLIVAVTVPLLGAVLIQK